MVFSKPFVQRYPANSPAQERLFEVSGRDLEQRDLAGPFMVNALPRQKPNFCDVWAAAKIDGALYGDFCVDAGSIPDDARFAALKCLIGDAPGETDRAAFARALASTPDTLLLAMWGETVHGEPFVAIFYHPAFTAESAKRWLLTLLGRGPLRTGWES